MDLTSGDLKKVLWKFSLPLIVLQLLNQLYAVVDSIIVSHFAGSNDFAILSNISTLTMLGYCLVQGGAIVSNVIFAKMFGEDNRQGLSDAKKTFNYIFFFYSLIITFLYCLLARQLLELIHIPYNLLNDAVLVLIIYALNFIPTGVNIVNQGILNGSGDSKTPMFICIIFQLLNLILDYIVVSKMQMGVLGAALASLIAASLSAFCMYYKANKLISLFNIKAYFNLTYLRKGIKMMIPSTLSQSVYSFGSFFLQIIVNNYGIQIINGYNVAFTLNNFLLCPLLGICNSYESFCGQNIGALKDKRVKDGFKFTLFYGTVIALISSLLTFIFNSGFISLYIKDKSLLSYTYASKAFKILVLNYFMIFYKNCFDAYYKGHQKMFCLAFVSIIILIIRILLSYLFTKTIGPLFLIWACIISNIIGVLIYLFVYKKSLF